ncbi:MAG TPA: membrane protein insertion efficiency factor YidD [Burkholderiaceae bacterium]|nr:membrane protein insertion efficiency factor YidD [Burkholderiaceae bacterium]
MTRVLLLVLRAYRFALSPLLGNQCRFVPTCSQYAMEAVERFGPGRGLLMAVRRVLRCHPWHAGGWDPVPANDPSADAHKGCPSLAPQAVQHDRSV